MRHIVVAAIGAVGMIASSGCNRKAPEQHATQVQVPESDYQVRLLDMPEGGRNAVLHRALQDAGRDCQNVDSSAFKGMMKGSPTWLAHCHDGSDWVIIIGSSGIAEVASRQEALQAGMLAGK